MGQRDAIGLIAKKKKKNGEEEDESRDINALKKWP